MSHRVLLIHSNAEEAQDRTARLRAGGFDVERLTAVDGRALLRLVAERAPDAVVIDLERLPSHGREVGGALRRQKATRAIPIVFAGGAADKVERARTLLPDAFFAGWDGVTGAVCDAIAHPPAKPFVPGTMAGYSGTPLPKKLGIKPGTSVTLLGAPDRFERKLEPLPDGVRLAARGAADVVLLFATSRADLVRRLPLVERCATRGMWVLWPKKTSAAASDLAEQFVRQTGLDAGWVDYKICAVDETWSGLLFTRRKNRR